MVMELIAEISSGFLLWHCCHSWWIAWV